MSKRIRRPRYSSTLILHYLMRRLRLNGQRIQRDLQQYYTEELWHLNKTKTGKIVSAKLRTGAQLPMFRRNLPQPTTEPTVTIRARRIINRPQ